MLIIDGVEWDVNPRKHIIESDATMNENAETSGMAISGIDLPDFTGTSLEFDVPIDTSRLSQSKKNSFYLIVTNPYAIHEMVLPINGTFDAEHPRAVKITNAHRTDLVDGENNVIYSTISSIHVVLQEYWRKP